MAKLRELILDLAVRGKLVEQDANDEPAAELLQRIEGERNKLVAEKAIRKLKSPSGIDEDDKPYDLPSNWKWARFGDIALELRYGTSKKCAHNSDGVAVLRIPNVVKGYIDTDDLKFAELSDKERDDLQLASGDLLLIRSNGSTSLVGRSAVVNGAANGFAFAGYLVRIKTLDGATYPQYLHLGLNSRAVRDQIEKPIRTTSGVKNINSTEIGNLLVPLPPLSEQRRIVSKVDGLMSLCDELESRGSKRVKLREHASRCCLDRLVSSRSRRDLSSAWQRLSDHFEVLYDTPETLAHLRQSILQLAVQGKLVPQDPNDEPAGDLLASIEETR